MSQLPDLAFEANASETVGGFIGSLGAQLSFYQDDIEEDDQPKNYY